MAWWDPLIWDWATIGKTALGAGVGTALVQGLLAIYRDRRNRKSHAAYMAMRLAVTLEFYAKACADFIQENANVQPPPPDEEYPSWKAELPELPAYPDDADGWRAIDCALAGRCLNLRNKIHASQGLIDETIEYNMDALGDTLEEQAAARGLEAWKLALALRRKHGVGKADMVWDYVETLERTLRKGEQQEMPKRDHLSDSLFS